jgi:hypothetical protein
MSLREIPSNPNEMRFFRVGLGVEEIPPTWNQEVADLTMVEIKAK